MKTGTSMQGRIENTRNVKRIPSVCKNCYHHRLNHGINYCVYYDLINPNKRKCARYWYE